jgi:hypothetical protein
MGKKREEGMGRRQANGFGKRGEGGNRGLVQKSPLLNGGMWGPSQWYKRKTKGQFNT